MEYAESFSPLVFLFVANKNSRRELGSGLWGQRRIDLQPIAQNQIAPYTPCFLIKEKAVGVQVTKLHMLSSVVAVQHYKVIQCFHTVGVGTMSVRKGETFTNY